MSRTRKVSSLSYSWFRRVWSSSISLRPLSLMAVVPASMDIGPYLVACRLAALLSGQLTVPTSAAALTDCAGRRLLQLWRHIHLANRVCGQVAAPSLGGSENQRVHFRRSVNGSHLRPNRSMAVKISMPMAFDLLEEIGSLLFNQYGPRQSQQLVAVCF